MKIDIDNGFSLLRLLAESELQRRISKKPLKKKQLSATDTNGIAALIKESLDNQTITIDDESYTITAMEVEDNAILLWLWSDSADDEKTIKITLRIDELKINSTYWTDDNV